jgi:hypothetical protein
MHAKALTLAMEAPSGLADRLCVNSVITALLPLRFTLAREGSAHLRGVGSVKN